eukprot:CAMPEP_0114683494 /NCGR_PEP_ID=MMETSP0191-20121206/57893_1 /TAXON_ID=126664 /ORGANISM="Sorites sp." /LENGTH=60 /DNA_ID=CAMNT_0001964751 /DNA_START=76 /DNA_END=254 /DNA_ORIENTATION=+
MPNLGGPKSFGPCLPGSGLSGSQVNHFSSRSEGATTFVRSNWSRAMDFWIIGTVPGATFG